MLGGVRRHHVQFEAVALPEAPRVGLHGAYVPALLESA